MKNRLLGWTHEFSSICPPEKKKELKTKASSIKVIHPQDLFSFLKKFFKEVKPFKSATIWFRPSPQQDDDGKKLKFFKQTYVLLMDGEGKNIELKKDYAETILHLRKNIKGNYDSIVECGEGYSAIKCLLKELF